jgi:16S rRNA (cytidine1402-2'-O)-methyltransferase
MGDDLAAGAGGTRKAMNALPAVTAGPQNVFYIDGQPVAAKPIAPGLHVVATPIGNLGDISLRALQTLAGADVIACEDTRVTRVLTGRYGITTRLFPYHDHNAEKQRPKLMALLDEGKAVALVSDAGTPLISDPGYRLVNAVVDAGHAVIPIPGASAVLAALVASGLPSDAFLFAGFLPPKEVARGKRLAIFAETPATLIFFESPQRLAVSLAAMASVLGGERKAAVARELTKTFETIRRDTLTALAARFAGEATPKGEIVVLVGPPQAKAPDAEDVDAMLAELLETRSVREAATEAAAKTGLPRRELYARALALKGEDDDGPA